MSLKEFGLEEPELKGSKLEKSGLEDGFSVLSKVRTVIIALTILVNCIVLIGILKNRSLRETRSNKHIISITTTHIILGILLIMDSFLNHIEGLDYMDDLYTFPYYSCCFNITSFTVERYIAIMYPFKYIEINLFQQRMMIASCWILTLILYSVQKVYNHITNGEDIFEIILVVILSITFVTVVILNTFIYRCVKKNKTQIQTQERVSATTQTTTDTNQNVQRFRQTIMSDCRIAYACFGAALSLLLLTGPHIIFTYVNNADFFYEKGDDRVPFDRARDILAAIASLNSICDPICFLYFNTKLLHEIKMIFKCRNSEI